MPEDELDFAMRVLDQKPGAAEAFLERFKKTLQDYLVSKCDRPEDKQEAIEVVDDLMARCCATGFLSKYSGTGSLEGFLKITAYNDLRAYWKKQGRNPVNDSIDRAEEEERVLVMERDEEETGESVDALVYQRRFMEATVHAFNRLKLEFPDCLAIVRLAMAHDVKQVNLARAFGIHESEIAKKKRIGLEFLKSEINTFLAKHFPRGSFTMADFREFAQFADEIVHDEDLSEELLDRFGGH
jgi:DNA-directed RNA polymerase specialized sigma24 family protein